MSSRGGEAFAGLAATRLGGSLALPLGDGVPRTGASIAGRRRFRGIRILEDLGQTQAKAGDDLATVKLGRLGQDPHRCQGRRDINLPGDGIASGKSPRSAGPLSDVVTVAIPGWSPQSNLKIV